MNFLKTYHRFTKHHYYSLFLVLPLWILYEVGIIWIHDNSYYKVRNLVDIFIERSIAWCGISGFFAFSIFLLLVCILLVRPKHNFLIFRGSYFFLMLFESSVLALVLVFSAKKSSIWFLMSLSPESVALWMGIVLSAGAGIYEEFLFRVIIFTSGIYLCKWMVKRSVFFAVLCSAIISSIFFAASHYLGYLGNQFTAYSFLYRFFTGLFFCVLIRLRGFAIAAYTHTLYDIFITLNFFG